MSMGLHRCAVSPSHSCTAPSEARPRLCHACSPCAAPPAQVGRPHTPDPPKLHAGPARRLPDLPARVACWGWPGLHPPPHEAWWGVPAQPGGPPPFPSSTLPDPSTNMEHVHQKAHVDRGSCASLQTWARPASGWLSEAVSAAGMASDLSPNERQCKAWAESPGDGPGTHAAFQTAGSYLVWDAATAAHLRTTYGVGTAAVGALPGLKAHLRGKDGALPVALSAEEAFLLAEAGVLTVLSSTASEAVSVDTLAATCDLIKAAVLRSLLLEGWRVTDGGRYGVDFLLYGTDPACAHAQHMVLVLRAADSPPTVLHVASLSRLATRTAKTLLVATVAASGHVHFKEVTRNHAPAALPQQVAAVGDSWLYSAAPAAQRAERGEETASSTPVNNVATATPA